MDYLDTINFKELEKLDPAELCKRALCEYDEKSKDYSLIVWNDKYRVSSGNNRIERITDNLPEPHEFMYVFILNYLLQIKELEPVGEWVSEKDLVGGATFFRGPHELPTSYIATRFKGDLDGFRRTCEALGGTSLDMADAAYAFGITPRISVAVLFWDQDDEFPPESKILFDKTIGDHLALDIVFALAVDVCARLSRTNPV